MGADLVGMRPVIHRKPCFFTYLKESLRCLYNALEQGGRGLAYLVLICNG